MSQKSYLDSIKSPAPCSKDWSEMSGDELVRFCQGCEKNVYNLSAMTRKEARKFVAKNSGKVCVRYVRLASGKVQTADTKLYKITRQTSRLAAGVLGATLTLSTVAQGQTTNPPKNEKEKTTKSRNKDYLKSSQISFTIVDWIGGTIANAKLIMTNQKTKEEFTTFSNQDGVAHFASLPLGRYSLDVPENFGFCSYHQFFEIREVVEPNIKIQLKAEGMSVVGDFTFIDYEIPLFKAVSQDDNDAVRQIIENGFDVKRKDNNGQTALHIAVKHGNLEIVRILLEKGAKVNIKDKDNQTPFSMLEEIVGDEEEPAAEIIRLLISKGADVNVQTKENGSILMMACFDDNLEIVKILLAAGANPNLKDEDGETAMDKTNSDEIKRLLISYGAKK